MLVELHPSLYFSYLFRLVSMVQVKTTLQIRHQVVADHDIAILLHQSLQWLTCQKVDRTVSCTNGKHLSNKIQTNREARKCATGTGIPHAMGLKITI